MFSLFKNLCCHQQERQEDNLALGKRRKEENIQPYAVYFDSICFIELISLFTIKKLLFAEAFPDHMLSTNVTNQIQTVIFIRFPS